MTDSQLIERLEAQWDQLMQKRHAALAVLIADTPKEHQHAIIQLHNEDPFWEGQFNSMESAIRALDPGHTFLPENQISL
jgi:hypothetical protein